MDGWFLVNLIEYVAGCARHDYTHEMSDDYSKTEAGRRHRGEVVALGKRLGDRALEDAIWNHFAPDYWKRKTDAELSE